MAITPGTQFDRYEILSVLGVGGMGEVYLANDKRLGRKVAFKTLPAQYTNEPDRLMRFEREARAASALNHPNIVTILDIGEVDDIHFMAHEYVEGESLRDRLAKGRLSPLEGLEIAIQIAFALGAAHEAGIFHRDIKPDNVILRRDGFVKLLDFGLAKLTEGQQRPDVMDTEAATLAKVTTAAGAVMGTPQYMSPEQARGEKVDGRTDIFSLGVALYEMIAGRPPFEGVNPLDVISSILKDEPAPLGKAQPDAPRELEVIVGKTLRKNRDERYQTAKELLADLKDLKHRLEFQAELERSVQPDGRRDQPALSAPTTGESDYKTALPGAAQAGQPAANTTSSQLHIPRRAMRIGVAVAALAVVAAALFYYLRPKLVLTDKDTILLTEFDNKTGDSVFDGTLKQGLAVQLGQSPFLNLFPDTRVRQTLRLMGRSPDERVTPEIGREICQRQGLKAFIAGSIAPLGSHYVLTLEAVNSQTGEALASEQVEAGSKEQVLKALGQAVTMLREKLGESLSSLQRFDAPLELTTSSLEALKVYSLGNEQMLRGRYLEAIPFFKRATELDPNFAHAYAALAVAYYNSGQPKLAAEYAEEAFALRDRVSELEKLRISYFYYAYVTGEVEKSVEVLDLYRRTYPRDPRAHNNLSLSYLNIGQFEKAAEAAREGISLDPNRSSGYGNLVENLIRLTQLAEAKAIIERARQQKLDDTYFHTALYQIAFINEDTTAMRQELFWASGKPDEHVALDWQTQAAAFAGQWKRAQDFARRAIDLAAGSQAKENAAQYAANAALRAAVFGQCAQAKAAAAQSLARERNKESLARAALGLALCGASSQTQSLAEELRAQYPKDTLVHALWLPTVRAALELPRGNTALELLQPVMRYEAAAEFWPQYLRGLAYLKLGKGAQAATEYRKILDHRGEAPLSLLWPLAHLGLGRAAVLQGDAAQSRQNYEAFFTLWKGADADLPALIEAKKEYEKLK